MSSCALGRLSVKTSGMINMMPTAKQFKTKEVTVAKDCRFFCCPNSKMLSANIAFGVNLAPVAKSGLGSTAAAGRLAGLTSFISGS